MYCGTCTEMTCTADSYYIINRNLLLCIGLWPYQRFGFRCILITLMIIILTSSTVFQFATLFTREYNMELLLKILAYSIPWLSYVLRYNIHWLNMKKMRDLIERIRLDWNELNNAHELEIIKKYSAIGRLITFFTTLFVYLAVFSFILIQLLINFVLDITTATNESRIRHLSAEIEVFIDQQKYFTPLLLYLFLIVLCGITTVIAMETLCMSYTQHACGLFEIAKNLIDDEIECLKKRYKELKVDYRIKQALHKDMIRDVISVTEKNSIICQEIISAVDIHRKAIEFIEMTKVNFEWMYFIAIPFAVLTLSINLYRLSRLITTEAYGDLITTLLFVLGHFWYLFFCNYIGQEVIDHSSDIFYKTYNIQWYIAPLKVQKLLLFVMRKSMRCCTLMIGGLFIPSLEGFATLISMSLSYFMIIYSIQ